MARIDTHWYRGSWWLWLLWPLSLLFCLLVNIRRSLYRTGLLRSVSFAVPVIVIGNITVGGSGKTPLVIYLVEQLRLHGYKPGVVSRGYGGTVSIMPEHVFPDSDSSLVGDEALMVARRCNCPLTVGPDRVAAINKLLIDFDVDVVISDDGMQHYRMSRDIEIAVLDGDRRLGNGLCLPAGPLRESASRLSRVDFVVTNGQPVAGEWGMNLQADKASSMYNEGYKELSDFRGDTVHAVAGIGNPERFFRTLRNAGITLTEHPFPDHYPYSPDELEFNEEGVVLMTEKDAVKYFHYAHAHHWYLPVTAEIDDAFTRQLLERLEKYHG